MLHKATQKIKITQQKEEAAHYIVPAFVAAKQQLFNRIGSNDKAKKDVF